MGWGRRTSDTDSANRRAPLEVAASEAGGHLLINSKVPEYYITLSQSTILEIRMKRMAFIMIYLISIGYSGNIIAAEKKVGFYGGLGMGFSGNTNRTSYSDFLVTAGFNYTLNKYGVVGAEYMMRKATRLYGSNNIIGYYELPLHPIVLQLGLGLVSDTYFKYTNAYFGSYWREMEASGFGFRAGVGYEFKLFDDILIQPMATLNLGLEEYATNFALSVNISHSKLGF